LSSLKRRVVGRGVTREVLLDRDELGGQQPAASKDERLDDPRDAAVAIPEGVYRDDMQMGHRRADDEVRIWITVLEPADDLAHECWNFLGLRTDIRRRSTPGVGDLNSALSVLARFLVLLEVAGVEVEIEHHAIDPSENGIARHDANVIHSPRVAGERHSVLVGRIRRLVSAGHRQRLILGYVKALDLDRALGGGCPPLSAQTAEPPSGNPGLASQLNAQLVERREFGFQGDVGLRSPVDHEYKYSRTDV